MEPEVGELLDEALVGVGDGGERRLDALPPPPSARPRRRRRRAGLRRTSPPAAWRRARRRRARARARSTTRHPCGRQARPDRRAAGSRRRRSRRASRRSPACSRTSRPCASTPGGSGSRTTPRRSRACAGAPPRPSTRASGRGRCRVLDDRGHQLARAQILTFHPASLSSAFSSGSRSGRSCTIEAMIAASAPTAKAAPRCAASPGPARGDHGHLDRLGERAREWQVVAGTRAVRVDRRHEQLAGTALDRLRSPSRRRRGRADSCRRA